MLDNLNQEQAAAATYAGSASNILVVAGAGTGKTRTMMGRTAYLLQEKGVSPSRILCLTFTNRAANMMVSRLRLEVTEETDELTACTFHSFCIQLIRRVPRSFGFETLPTIIDQAAQGILMSDSLASVLEKAAVNDEDRALIPKADAIARQYSFARNAMRDPQEQFREHLVEAEPILALALETVAEYERQKTEYQYVDFDDILYRFVEVAEDKPTLAEAISNLFDEVLVDELQDTNPVQYRILRLLGAGSARIFAVGDPAQSIYGFRGSDFNSIHNFTTLFPHSVRFSLSVNYRSTQEILDVSNELLRHSTFTYDNFLSASKGRTGQKAVLHDFTTSDEEAAFIARDIVDHYQGGGHFSDIFVITRSAYAARAVEGALRQRKVPYAFVGGLSINKTAHVQDVLALIKLGLNPRDKLSCLRYLKLFKGVGDVSASRGYARLAMATDEAGRVAAIEATVRKAPAVAGGLFTAVRQAITQRSNPIHALLAAGFDRLLCDKYPDSHEYRIHDIKVVGDIFRQYRGDIEGFINDFTLEPEVSRIEQAQEEEDKVTLITAHSAKGLERKRCYVIGAVPGIFPSRRSIGTRDAEEEERRVLYVALTRAIDTLILTRNMEYSNHVFTHAVTDIDFIHQMESVLDRRVRKANQQIAGIAGLQDIF